MNKDFQIYIEEILDSIGVNGKKRKLIREDLYVSLMEKQEITGESDPYILLGDPEEIAEEFRENLEISHNPRYFLGNRHGYRRGHEYVSKVKVFGIPLVHVNTKPLGIAKGIFACGSIAVGLFSFGIISIGAIGFGAISLAIAMAIGGVAFSGLLSLGGVAVSYAISLGGAAIAKYIAIGGYARADIAIGEVAKGIVAVFNQNGTGQYIFKNPVDPDEVISAIKQVHPSIGKSLLEFIRFFL
ncbi:hypothetical protein SAMN05444401_1935 [Clostridium amylolyticum]|uniref:Uncharacterized protein n=1 Tax=Clostridium amylolyticum TaxID=1121298 RepID=A0A1M6FGI4_9CLOT|nr:hypothetical protein [Clostridium amylolyticum]SHI96844.1 hypothetical protein SAMN05444401_1935 [Clostridium amylolyticum]